MAVTTGIERFFNKPAKFGSAKSEPAERELQDKLYGLFLGMHSMGIESVKRAYLTEVQYNDIASERLAVCLVADRNTAERTAAAIGKVFEAIYTNGRLDILFVSSEQEREIEGICKAFFNA